MGESFGGVELAARPPSQAPEPLEPCDRPEWPGVWQTAENPQPAGERRNASLTELKGGRIRRSLQVTSSARSCQRMARPRRDVA